MSHYFLQNIAIFVCIWNPNSLRFCKTFLILDLWDSCVFSVVLTFRFFPYKSLSKVPPNIPCPYTKMFSSIHRCEKFGAEQNRVYTNLRIHFTLKLFKQNFANIKHQKIISAFNFECGGETGRNSFTSLNKHKIRVNHGNF